MRPRTLDEFVGQDHIIGPGRLLRRAIEADQLTSIILWGPPGTGKTTLANIIANRTRRHFSRLNAVTSGVKELRELIAAAQERLGMYGQGTVLFIDEIHRWNKAQQDGLLPFVEDGTVVLIGSTTENPFFSLVNPLLSRSRVFQLVPLREEEPCPSPTTCHAAPRSSTASATRGSASPAPSSRSTSCSFSPTWWGFARRWRAWS
jgi:putative ATPase